MGTKTESECGVNAIDRSFRWPALMFLVSGVKWLMLALMLGLLMSTAGNCSHFSFRNRVADIRPPSGSFFQ